MIPNTFFIGIGIAVVVSIIVNIIIEIFSKRCYHDGEK